MIKKLKKRRDRSTPITMYPNNIYDPYFDLENDTATYEFEVIDCAGNISERSSFTVEKGSVPNNVILDSPYNGPTESDTTSDGTEESGESNDTSERIKTQSETKTGNNTSSEENLMKTIGIPLAAAAAVAIGYGIYKALKRKKKNKK